jgi:hypothetical protein
MRAHLVPSANFCDWSKPKALASRSRAAKSMVPVPLKEQAGSGARRQRGHGLRMRAACMEGIATSEQLRSTATFPALQGSNDKDIRATSRRTTSHESAGRQVTMDIAHGFIKN